MPRTRLPLLLTAAALALPATAAAQRVEDFQLPPNPTPTSSPNVQGPVDDSGVVPVGPRARPTPTPTPRATAAPAPAPAPTPTATPRPRPSATGTAPPRFTPAPTRVLPGEAPPDFRPSRPEAIAPPTEQADAPIAEPQTMPAPSAQSSVPTAFPTSPAPPASTPSIEAGGDSWWWAWLLAALLAVAGVALYFWRQGRPLAVPAVVRPEVSGDGAAAPVASGPPDLRLSAEPVKLTRSMMMVTLEYRLAIANRGTGAARNCVVEVDFASAHSRLPVDQQLASDAKPLEERHRVDRIAPGRTVNVSGSLQVPVSELSLIRQGNAVLYVPLLQCRVTGEGFEPQARTFVIGTRAATPGARLQPFRRDEPPQSYAPLAARALD